MTNVTIASAMLLFLSIVFFSLIPWMFKLAVLYGLHSSRDDAYALGRMSPSMAKTRIYNDVLLIHTHAIHLVRNEGAQACLHYFTRYTRQRRADDRDLEVYGSDLAAICSEPDGQRHVAELMRLFNQAHGLVVLRVATCHPIVTVCFSALLLVMRCEQIFRLLTADGQPEDGPLRIARHYALTHS